MSNKQTIYAWQQDMKDFLNCTESRYQIAKEVLEEFNTSVIFSNQPSRMKSLEEWLEEKIAINA